MVIAKTFLLLVCVCLVHIGKSSIEDSQASVLRLKRSVISHKNVYCRYRCHYTDGKMDSCKQTATVTDSEGGVKTFKGKCTRKGFLEIYINWWPVLPYSNRISPTVNKIWPTAVAGEAVADRDSFVSVSACHMAGQNLLVYGTWMKLM